MSGFRAWNQITVFVPDEFRGTTKPGFALDDEQLKALARYRDSARELQRIFGGGAAALSAVLEQFGEEIDKSNLLNLARLLASIGELSEMLHHISADATDIQEAAQGAPCSADTAIVARKAGGAK